jgi:iron transport multicopper oxidase
MFYLFMRELFWQLMAALHEVDEDEAAEEAEWALADEAALAAERAEGRLSTLRSGEGGDASSDEDDDAGVWRSPPVREEDEPHCGTGQRVCWALAACFALALGLGLGLRREVVPLPYVPIVPVARYTLVIGRGPTLADSGKYGITVNGSSPGPTLRVPLGSRAEVTVINELGDDVTSVHWHGLSQRGTPFADGSLGVTQCGVPFTPAGANHMMYAFTPERPGTFFYHGHYAGQYVDGLYGLLIVDDGGAAIAAAAAAAHAAHANATSAAVAAAPSAAVGVPVNTSASYDGDSWVWMAADWHEAPVMSLLPGFLSGEGYGGYEPMPDAIIVSGARSGAAGAAYSTARSARQLVRVVNAAALSMFRVSVDGMPLTLVELDGTACEPMDVAALELNAAQRAAFVLDWSRLHADIVASPAIYFRVDSMPEMYRSYDPGAPDLGLYGGSSGQPFNPGWRGVIRFEEDMRRSGATVMPNYTAPPPLALTPRVDTPNLFAARSWPPEAAPAATHEIRLEVTVRYDENGVRRALMNGFTSPMDGAMGGTSVPELYPYTSASGGPLSDEDAPLGGRISGSGASPFVIPLNAVVDVLINNTDGGEHPFHLHGHTFWTVASSAAPGAGAAYAPHYVRRDVVSVPASGWARIRFVADNPGVWLFHCHVEWHVLEGMSATFVEAPSELAGGNATGRFAPPPSHAAACALAAGAVAMR